MRFHHMCLVTTDLDASIAFWRDLMGFSVEVEMNLPDGEQPGPTVFCDAKLMDTAFEASGSTSRMALLSSSEGALIELQQPLTPDVARTPDDKLRYRNTGIHELGLTVDDIDAFFEKVRAAGYRTQTDYVWSSATAGRSFIFYDDQGNMIQLWEQAAPAKTWT